jgi:hypothetical protein
MTDLSLAAITATGASAARTLVDRWTDVVNIRDFGAVGNNTHDDTDAIQAAFDYAFTASGTPHGIANAHLNKPVYLPAGRYVVTDPLIINNLYGGHIFGAGQVASIVYNGPQSPCPAGNATIKINGMINSKIERCNFQSIGPNFAATTDQNNTCMEIDYDGTSWSEVGTSGLHGNTFSEVGIGGANWGIKLAPSGYDGARNYFYACYGNNLSIGMLIESATALHNKLMFSGFSSGANFKSLYTGLAAKTKGIHIVEGGVSQVIGGSMAGNVLGDQWDILSETTHPMIILGLRTENTHNFNLAGSAIIRGITLGSGAAIGFDTLLVTHSPSKYILESVVPLSAKVTGDGKLHTRGISISIFNEDNFFADFTGTQSGTIVWVNYS